MKITKYIWLIFVVALYIVNYTWLKINVWVFTGIALGLLLILVIAINIVIKIKDRKKGKNPDDFIFPTKVANTMKVIDIATQYEASILSIFCLMVGILLFVIYVTFIAPYNLITKIFIDFNSICGIALMGSMLVTNYQQLTAHKESTRVLGELANQFGTEILSPDKMKSGTILTPLEACLPPLETSLKPLEPPPRFLTEEEKKKLIEELKPKEDSDDDNFTSDEKEKILHEGLRIENTSNNNERRLD